jgi:hypothetical protein
MYLVNFGAWVRGALREHRALCLLEGAAKRLLSTMDIPDICWQVARRGNSLRSGKDECVLLEIIAKVAGPEAPFPVAQSRSALLAIS